MTPEEGFESIERNLAITSAVNAETAQIQKRIAKNLDEYISESREGRKNLQATPEAFLRAMLGRTNDKT